MSVENFKKFGQLCAEDPAIREKVKAIGIENIDSWIAYSKDELGLEFSKEDIETLAAEVGPENELSEEQLEQVAGGFITATAGAAVAGMIALAGAAAGGAAALGAVAGAAIAVVRAIRRW